MDTFFISKSLSGTIKQACFFGKGGEGVTSCVAVFFHRVFKIAAVVVRFLTGRYLSEYASPEEVTYERNVLVDEKQVSIKITDVAGKVGLLCHVHV